MEPMKQDNSVLIESLKHKPGALLSREITLDAGSWEQLYALVHSLLTAILLLRASYPLQELTASVSLHVTLKKSDDL